MKSDNPSIAQQRTSVNHLPTNPRDLSKLRGQARVRVACDGELSPGCSSVYIVLDDWGRASGITPALTEAEIAEKISRSERRVQTWIQELESRGYVQRKRVARGCEYTVRWAAPAAVPAPVDSAKFAETPKSIRQTFPVDSAKFAETPLQVMPSLTPKHSVSSVGGWVNTAAPAATVEQPPARPSTKIEVLNVRLREFGYAPDQKLLERLMRSVPEECPIEAAVAVLQRRITRRHSKQLTQPMLPVFFAEDVPVKWQAEAAILEIERKQVTSAQEYARRQSEQYEELARATLADPRSSSADIEMARIALGLELVATA